MRRGSVVFRGSPGASVVVVAALVAALSLLLAAAGDSPVATAGSGSRSASSTEAGALAVSPAGAWREPSAQTGEVGLELVPLAQSVSVGEAFAVELRVDATSQPVDQIELHLDFDRASLRVVDPGTRQEMPDGPDARGVAVVANPAGPGNVVVRQVRNSAGKVDYVAAARPQGPNAGSFVAATVHFKAVGATAAGSLSFSAAPPRVTGATLAGYPVGRAGAGKAVAVR